MDSQALVHRRRNMEEMAAGKPSKRDIFTHGPCEGVHRARQVDIAKQLLYQPAEVLTLLPLLKGPSLRSG